MRLWIPGPTEVRPEILAEGARAMIGHRSGAMTALIERLDPHLRLGFGLAQASDAQVAVHTSSATGLMEASLLGAGERVLCMVHGAFGKRYHEIAELLGKRVHVLKAREGSAVTPDELARALDEHGPFDAVTLVVNETATGVRTPLRPIAQVLERHPDTLLLADLVTYFAGAPVDFDAQRIDFGFTGSQKALALPPGLAVGCASKRYLERARRSVRRSFYLDPVRIFEGHAERKTPSTPAISLYYALARQLEDISAGNTLPAAERDKHGAAAWQARYDKHARMAERTSAWASSVGLEPLPAPELRSPTVACIHAGGMDVPAFLKRLESAGHKAGSGYGGLKDTTFRIGHMGDHTEEDLESLLAAATEAVRALRR